MIETRMRGLEKQKKRSNKSNHYVIIYEKQYHTIFM